ncbi:hypothetical protein TNCV_4132491 [Trichonephila clavipes]|nr:hypothetical protein TNCV_4132491 [Trichonephila clavipes]
MESEKAKRTALHKSLTICTNNIEKTIEDGKSSTDDFIALQELFQDMFKRLVGSQEIVSVAILSKEAETYRDRLRNPSVFNAEEPYSQKLKQLLKVFGLEVKGEQTVLLAKSGLNSDISRNKTEQCHRNEDINTSPTSAVSTVDRKSVIIKSKACFKCLKEKQSARFCRNKNLRCGFCSDKWHHLLLCYKKELNKADIENAVSNTLSNQTQENSYVYLQTIPLNVCGGNRELVMRCLSDSGQKIHT